MNKTALHDDHCTCMCAADAYGKKKEIGEIPNESFFAHLLIENRFFFKAQIFINHIVYVTYVEHCKHT